MPDDQLLAIARRLSADDRAAVLRAYLGERGNRRHKPGRAFERTSYRFDVLTDYGAFRDLQRHRLLTIEWQRLSTRHGYTEPDAIRDAGVLDDWTRVMDDSASLHESLASAGLADAAQYAVSMAYRIRFYVEMNAREAMHVIELRTAPQGHPAYRRVCQQMHRLIADQAGHTAIAAAMTFADHSEVELERLKSERALDARRTKGRLTLFLRHVPGIPEAAELVQECQRLERLHPIEEQHAVEMIRLVLHDAGGEPLHAHLQPAPLAIVGAHLDRGRARHLPANAGNAQAAFPVLFRHRCRLA